MASDASTQVTELTFDSDSLYALRAAVAAHASAAGLNRQRVYDVVAATHELAANAVRHGAGHGRLRLWADGKSLYCQVSDDGPTVPPTTDGNRNEHTASWRTSQGHGLWVVDQVADQITLDRSRGTIATVEFSLQLPSRGCRETTSATRRDTCFSSGTGIREQTGGH